MLPQTYVCKASVGLVWLIPRLSIRHPATATLPENLKWK